MTPEMTVQNAEITRKTAPPLILRLDATGVPQTWAPWQEAVTLYCRGRIAWTAGARTLTFRGGVSRVTGHQSHLEISSIIAVKRGHKGITWRRRVPPLSNHELFRRDSGLCMYCGEQMSTASLTRDHVVPLSMGGRNEWTNVVTACHTCNTRKGGRTPEQANMQLLAIPYIPNWAEYLVLSNRRILADQMEFLRARFSKKKRHARGMIVGVGTSCKNEVQ